MKRLLRAVGSRGFSYASSAARVPTALKMLSQEKSVREHFQVGRAASGSRSRRRKLPGPSKKLPDRLVEIVHRHNLLGLIVREREAELFFCLHRNLNHIQRVRH